MKLTLPTSLPRAALIAGLIAFSAASAGAAERVVLTDGRCMLIDSRKPVDGGWLVALPDGGSLQVPAYLVDRFEPVEVLREQTPAPAAAEAPAAQQSGLSSEETLQELVNRIALEFSMDPRLVEAVVYVESRFDRFAVSPKGAAGLMQLMPGTARRFEVSDVFDAAENIRGGVRYLKQLSDQFRGDLTLMLAAYNAGEGAVQRHVGIPPYRETRQYVIRVLERYLQPKPAKM